MELNKDNMKRAMVLILYTVAILALAFHMEYVAAFLKAAFRLLFPFLAGAAIAFILNVPMRFIENRILGGVLKMKEDSRLKRPASLLLAIFSVLAIMAVVVLVVVPELTDTLMGLKRLVPAFFENMQIQAERIFAQYPEIVEYINSIEVDWKTLMEDVAAFVTVGAGSILSSTVTAAVSIASGLTTLSISFIFSLYILLQKETLSRQFKRLFYAYFPEKAVDRGLDILRMTERIFSKFLTGQCAEAVILGTMFFITLTVLRLPFALLIGVLIAFTALIPIFGAFIGCAVGIFLMLMVSPMQALWFTIIFFVLQQIEGNLIYPHVVGGSVGLPSIWVLAAVSLGGSMLGIMGMLVFIPLCSVAYALIKEDVGIQLKEKKIERAKWTSAREQKAQEKQEKDLGTPSEAEHKN